MNEATIAGLLTFVLFSTKNYENVIDVVGVSFFFFQAEDGIRDCLLSRGLGDVYKRQDYRGI